MKTYQEIAEQWRAEGYEFAICELVVELARQRKPLPERGDGETDTDLALKHELLVMANLGMLEADIPEKLVDEFGKAATDAGLPAPTRQQVTEECDLLATRFRRRMEDNLLEAAQRPDAAVEIIEAAEIIRDRRQAEGALLIFTKTIFGEADD